MINNSKLNKSQANLKCISSPSLFSCNYWLVPNHTLANWESKMTASSLLNFQSNYQIHLNLIIFQTLGWYLYIIRAICWYSKQPVFLNNLLKKVSLFLNSLHASPSHWVIKILLPLLKVYHAIYWDCSPLPAMFPLLYQFQFSSSDHILHQWAGFCQCGLVSVNCSVDLISACFMECLTLLEAK